MLGYTPSRVAAAAVNIALRTLKGPATWDRKLEHHSGFTQEALRACIKDVEELMNVQPNSLKAVQKKYAVSVGGGEGLRRPLVAGGSVACGARACAAIRPPPPLSPFLLFLTPCPPLLALSALPPPLQLPKCGEVSAIAFIPLA